MPILWIRTFLLMRVWEAMLPGCKIAPCIVPLAILLKSAYCDMCFGAGVLNVPGEAS